MHACVFTPSPSIAGVVFDLRHVTGCLVTLPIWLCGVTHVYLLVCATLCTVVTKQRAFSWERGAVDTAELFPLPGEAWMPHWVLTRPWCVQDRTLRLWQYRSGRELHCCHLPSLQEPAEPWSNKVTSRLSLVYRASLQSWILWKKFVLRWKSVFPVNVNFFQLERNRVFQILKAPSHINGKKFISYHVCIQTTNLQKGL